MNHKGKEMAIDQIEITLSRLRSSFEEVNQYIKEFQEKGNINAHSLFNVPHQDFIEERKDKINVLIKKLNIILQRLD